MKKLLIIIFLFALIDGLYGGQGPLENGIDVYPSSNAHIIRNYVLSSI